MPHRLLAISLLLLIQFVANASDLQFRSYTTDQGMTSNCVRDLLQTPDGYIWMATDGGVLRFDGHNFRKYPLSYEEGANPDDNFTMALCLRGTDLFVGTDTQIYRYDDATDSFSPVPLTCDGQRLQRLDVRRMASDNDGYLWVSALGAGLYRVDPEGQATQYRFPQYNNYVGDVFVDYKGDIWTVSNQGEGQVMRYDRQADRFVRLGGESASHTALAIAEDHNHNLWLGTWDRGLVCINPSTLRDLYRSDAEESRLMRHVHSLRFLPDGRLLVGSDAGFVIMDTASGKLHHYASDVSDPQSLSDSFVYPIITDHEGGIWIGTYYGGVNYLRPNLKMFDRMQMTRDPGSLGCKIVSDIKEDRKGTIWIASDDGGLNSYDPNTGTYRHIDIPYTEGGVRHVPTNLHTLCFDGDDLWVGTYTNGVLVYNTATGATRQFTSLENDETTLASRSSYAIFRDSRSVIWVATGSWVNVYNRGTDDFRRVRDLGGLIVDIKEDVDGALWFATHGGGLWRYDAERGEWSHHTHDNTPGSLPHDHVNCVCVDSRNNVVVGTVRGLSRYNRASGEFAPIDICVKGASVLSVIEDSGVYWLTTDMGLVKYDGDGVCEVFTRDDGLTSSQFMYNSMLRASNGRIYLGTRSGITAFYPYQLKLNNIRPNIVFTGLDVPSSEHASGKPHYEGNISRAKRIVLHPEDYTFSISYAALSYTNPDKNQYEYMLEGFDKDWIRAGSENKATYTNLPAGKYRFRVRASNSDNIWNEEGISTEIEVLSPWYLTWPMKALYLLLALGAVALAVIYVIRRRDREHKVEIRRINSSKEIEVYQAKLSFFTMIAHEIRTPVSLIIGPLEKIMHSPEKLAPNVSKDLTVIERNSQRLLFLVNQLLDFKKVEDSQVELCYRNVPVKPLIEAVIERFRPSMEQRSIRLEFKYDVDHDFRADVDAEGLTKLLSNLLNNARKFTRDYVCVDLHADTDTGQMRLSVTDNGVGISKENISKIFRPFYQVVDREKPAQGGTGLGLSIVQSMVEGHGGKIRVESTVGQGSTFIVTLPVHQAVVDESVPPTDLDSEPAEGMPQPLAKKKEEEEKPCLLVVDDNEELCTFIANSFEKDYEVVTAPDGVEAMAILRQRPVSFIISDWMMPRLDGAQLCKEVRADRNISHIPFILLTAKTDNVSRVEGLNIGADAYVDKPFSLQMLQARVQNLLNMRAVLREKFAQTPLEPLESVATTTADNEILSRLSAVIEENFSNPDLDIDFLAAKLDISRSGLYNKIKSLVDTTPNELIRITRLKHAARLLAEHRYRINEVCYMVGFNSTSYFSKCFQKQFGVTPTEFISQN